MAAVTICSDFGAQENKICHCFHFPPIYSLIYWQIVRFFSSSVSLLSMANPCLTTVFMRVLFWWVSFSPGCIPRSASAMLKGSHVYSLRIFTESLLPEEIISHYFLLPVCENSSSFTAVIVRFPALSQSEKHAMLCICRLHLHFLCYWCGWASCPTFSAVSQFGSHFK